MKDLFGAEHPDPPPMDAPLPFVLWRMELPDVAGSDPEYWLARTKEEAETAYLTTYEWAGAPPRVEAHEVTAAPVADGEDEPLSDAGAAYILSCINYAITSPRFFCGGDE